VTTRACPRDIRTCPGSEPANRTAVWSPGLMACPSSSPAAANRQWTDQAGLNHACDAPRRLRCFCAGSTPGLPVGAVSVSCQPFLTLQFNARHGPEVTQIRYPTIGWPDTCLPSGVLSSLPRLLARTSKAKPARYARRLPGCLILKEAPPAAPGCKQQQQCPGPLVPDTVVCPVVRRRARR
jgi:hypothetical protein